MAVVLVAEDEPAVRTLVCMVLQMAGYSVIPASNGLEAIALYRTSPERFDLVLTDLDMPVMDGYQLVTLIRESTPDARIVCMSGNPREVPPRVSFLQKPFTPQALKDALHQMAV